MANFIAAHTHFCLTETFVNFDPTPNALRNTTPFPQQNNQQNRLSHATVLRDTFRFSILIRNCRIQRVFLLLIQESTVHRTTVYRTPITDQEHWSTNRLQDTDHSSRALLNQPSTGHRSLIKSYLLTHAQLTVQWTPLLLRYHLTTYTYTNKFIIINNNNFLIIQSSTTQFIPSNNSTSTLLTAEASIFLTAGGPSLLKAGAPSLLTAGAEALTQLSHSTSTKSSHNRSINLP